LVPSAPGTSKNRLSAPNFWSYFTGELR
jgi:hypothetical protein